MSDLANESLTGKQFQDIVQDRCEEYKKLGTALVSQYGVQGVFFNDQWQPVQSLPDFEGVSAAGHQFIFDCKVCSQASFQLGPYRENPPNLRGKKFRQLKHMRERARFNCACFFLIHWNVRILKTSSEPAETFVFPIEDNPFWDAFDEGRVTSFNREHCDRYGFPVQWNLIERARTFRPDFYKCVQARLEFGEWAKLGVAR